MAVNNKVKITIDGKSFTLMGPETEEHMMQVAGYIDQKMTEIRKNSKAVAIDSSLAYILTSINVANDYFKEVKQHLEQEETMEELRLQVMSEKAKTAGMIISPAMIAIAVSKISTFSVDFSMEISFFI